MSDLQPGVNDIVIAEARSGYAVSVFGSVGSARVCSTLIVALSAAAERARHAGVDVWYADGEATWRVRRYSVVDDGVTA